MSAFLDSILDSIDGKSGGPDLTKTATPRTGPLSDGKVLGSATSTTGKRKVEPSSNDPPNKVQRTGASYKDSGQKQPYTGSGPKRPANSGSSTDKVITRPESAGRPIVKRPASTSGNGVVPKVAISPSPSTAVVPKKGSYAEIMARAQKQSQTSSALGAITHKASQKLTLAQRKAQAEEDAKNKREAARKQANGKSSRTQSPAKSKPVTSAIQKPKDGAANSGYQGTMRPAAAPSAYTGTMRTTGDKSRISQNHNVNTKGAKHRMAGHANYSEDDDDDLETDWDDESDMEAGMDELEEEEFTSRRIARREDLQAQREEEEHRRKKLERKNRR